MIVLKWVSCTNLDWDPVRSTAHNSHLYMRSYVSPCSLLVFNMFIALLTIYFLTLASFRKCINIHLFTNLLFRLAVINPYVLATGKRRIYLAPLRSRFKIFSISKEGSFRSRLNLIILSSEHQTKTLKSWINKHVKS